jgi:hypothetical protein
MWIAVWRLGKEQTRVLAVSSVVLKGIRRNLTITCWRNYLRTPLLRSEFSDNISTLYSSRITLIRSTFDKTTAQISSDENFPLFAVNSNNPNNPQAAVPPEDGSKYSYWHQFVMKCYNIAVGLHNDRRSVLTWTLLSRDQVSVADFFPCTKRRMLKDLK